MSLPIFMSKKAKEATLRAALQAEQEDKIKSLIEKEGMVKRILMDAWESHKKGRINKEDIPDISIKIVKEIYN